MRGRYFPVSRKVADRPRNAQHTLMRARRQIESFGRILEQGPALVRSITDIAQRITVQAGIAYTAAAYLQRPGLFNALLHYLARFTVAFTGAQQFRRWAQNFNVQVNTIE